MNYFTRCGEEGIAEGNFARITDFPFIPALIKDPIQTDLIIPIDPRTLLKIRDKAERVIGFSDIKESATQNDTMPGVNVWRPCRSLRKDHIALAAIKQWERISQPYRIRVRVNNGACFF